MNEEVYDFDLSCMSDEEIKPYIQVVQDGNLDCLHKHNLNGGVKGVYDNNIVEYIKRTEHLFFFGGTPYIYANGTYKADINGVKLKAIIKSLMYSTFVNIGNITKIYDLIKIDESLQKNYEDLNKHPYYTIPFKNGLFNALDGKIYSYSSIGAEDLYIINQIPHRFDMITTPPHDKIDKWLDFICPAADDKEMLLQYAGLCMTHDVGQQKFLMLKGVGGTGKSNVINLISDMVGHENKADLSLEQVLGKDFLTYSLMGKIFNSCSDIKTKPIEDTAIIKKLVGEDTLVADIKKNPVPVTFKSYAKFIFSTNELPIVKEKSNGFYRRMLVLEMNRKPEKVNPNLLSELETQLDGFIWLSVKALQRMYKQVNMTVSNNSKRLTDQHQAFSDSVSAFIYDNLEKCEHGKLNGSDLHKAYKQYCEQEERTPLGRNGFFKSMEDKGYSRPDGRNFNGLTWKKTNFEPVGDTKTPF